MKDIHEVINLATEEMPEAWYNILPDLPEPLPPMKDPDTGPSRISLMEKIYVKKFLDYEENYKDKWIPISEDIRQAYIHVGRPTPLCRAWRMEKLLDTPAHIYYKNEGVSPTGSYKIISNLAQAAWAKEEGIERVVTCSAGTQGSALGYAAATFGMKATVFIDAASYAARPGRILHFKQMGAEVVRSPSNMTSIGKRLLSQDPNHPGSWLTSALEMLEVLDKDKTKQSAYLMGSANTCNIMFLTIMGLELKKQLEIAEEDGPDVIVDCAAAGGNWSGICLPFIKDRLDGKSTTRFVACQPEGWAVFLDGTYEYTDGFVMNPLSKVYSIGWRPNPPQIHAKGLMIPVGAIIPSYLRRKGVMEVRKYSEKEIAKTTLQWTKTEGNIPAIEATYAIKGGIDEAIKAKEEGRKKVIIINVSGHGYYDVEAHTELLKMAIGRNI